MSDNSTETQSDANAEAAGRQIVVHAQYIKDLSFENPNAPDILMRSEERRVGKECRSRWSPYH